MNDFTLGAIAVSAAMIGLFFLKFHRSSRDRFFLMFAMAFWLEALGRVLEAALSVPSRSEFAIYAVRLAAYVLILAAILDKNLRRAGRTPHGNG